MVAARSRLMSGVHDEAHYQAVIMDLVDTVLLGTGSLYGSAAAPSGSEGTMYSDQPPLDRRICHKCCINPNQQQLGRLHDNSKLLWWR
jgi:hypothetical protein